MSNGFKELGISVQKTVWFKWGIKKQSSNEIAKELYATKCDAVLLVANSKEGASLVNAIARNKTSYTLPIISHWGITGGDFHKTVPYDIRESVELSFIQTKFNFITSKLDKSSNILLKKMISEYSDISSEKDIMAPSGFIHAYDLGRILVTALKSVDVEKDIKTIRFNLKNELENLKSPVKGLLKKYTRPFEKYTKLKKDAHEALDIKDFAIGSYGPNGETINKSWDF